MARPACRQFQQITRHPQDLRIGLSIADKAAADANIRRR